MPRTVVVRAAVAASLLLSIPSRPAAGQPLPVHAGTRLLRSGPLVVEIGDPESGQCLWNKGLRFSPVGNVLRVQLHGQEFLYSPIAGGALGYLGGLPMEFDIGQEAFQPDPPGYNEGGAGSPFLKIGVGILRRDGALYNFSASYPVIELARTTATWGPDRVYFVQTLAGTANGYSCHLEEEVVVKNDRIVMKYLLGNTGTKTFTTEQYLHNFLSFAGRGVGPNVRLSFPYDITTLPEVLPWQPPAKVRAISVAAQPTTIRIANAIEYTDRASGVPKIWVYKPDDYTGPDRFGVDFFDTRQRMTIEASIPAAFVGIWVTDYQVSPEQFIQVTLAPGEQIRFARTYVFRVSGSAPQDATGDRTVDTNDLAAVSASWLSEPGEPRWNPACDAPPAADDRIDFRDFAALATQWRQEGGLPAPVAHWRLDDATGRALIDERGRHAGVLHNFPEDDSQWVAGIVGGGLQFDGIDDSATIDPCPTVAGDAPRTIMAWVKFPESPSSNQVILAWEGPTLDDSWVLRADASRKLRFSCGQGYAVATRLVGDRHWHHIAAVLDPLIPDSPRTSDVRLYVDGTLQIVYETAEHPIGAGPVDRLSLGSPRLPTDTPFHGLLDDIRIYPAALNPIHISSIYREATDLTLARSAPASAIMAGCDELGGSSSMEMVRCSPGTGRSL